MLRPNDLFLIPFSLFWGGFAIFWETQALSHGAPPFFALWGIPFAAVGAYVVVGRFLHDAWRRKRTSYGLTDQRVIVAYPRETKMIDLTDLGVINLREASDGRCSIIFGVEANIFSQNNFGAWSGRPSVPTFEKIKDGKNVLSAIREAQKKARAKA